MRILVLNYEFPPVGGGSSAASFYTARELARLGHQIDVLTCRVEGQPEFETINGVNVYRVASARKSIHDAGLRAVISYMFFARSVLRKLLQENSYDYGHFYFAVPTGLLSFLWRTLTDAPYVVSLRGSDVPNYDPKARGINFVHRALMPVTRKLMRRAGCIVANSESLRRLALASFQDEKIITITNGVCPMEFTPAEKIGKDNRTVTALCVARLIPRKGIAAVLDAIATLDSSIVRLVIAGTGPEKAALVEQAKRLKVDDRIEFVGSKTGKELVACYQQSDFLIHPTLIESFSMTLLEAMSCGLPIITSNVGGIPELVEHEVNGLLITPGDIPELAEAIKRMAGSQALRSSFSGENRARILRQFTWEHITKQYEQQCFANATPAAREYPS